MRPPRAALRAVEPDIAATIRQIAEQIQHLARRIDGIAAMDALMRYQPAERPDGTFYDSAAQAHWQRRSGLAAPDFAAGYDPTGVRLAAAVSRRLGLTP